MARIGEEMASSNSNGNPPQLPKPVVPHVYIERGLGTGKVEKK